MADEEEVRKSSKEKVNDTINKAQSVYKNAKRAKKAATAARTGGRVALQAGRAAAQGAAQLASSAASAAASGLAATSEAWGPPVLIAAAFVLLVVVGFTIMLSVFNPPTTSGSSTCSGTCVATTGACTGTVDTGVTCSDPSNPVCCIPAPTTTACSTPCQATACQSPNIQDPNATCSDPSTPYCCIPKPACSNSTIVSWAQKIDSALQIGGYCNGTPMYNRMEATVTNGTYTATKEPGTACGISSGTYFCSNLVIDSYNLAGLTNSLSIWVPTMVNQWGSLPGGSVVKTNNVSVAQPGDAIFWTTSSGFAAHVDIIYTISVDSSGNGTIVTLDANTNSPTQKFYVINWAIKGIWTDGANYPWFGLVKCI